MITIPHSELCDEVHNYFTSWFSYENWVIFINVLLFISIHSIFRHTLLKVEMMSHALLPY